MFAALVLRDTFRPRLRDRSDRGVRGGEGGVGGPGNCTPSASSHLDGREAPVRLTAGRPLPRGARHGGLLPAGLSTSHLALNDVPALLPLTIFDVRQRGRPDVWTASATSRSPGAGGRAWLPRPSTRPGSCLPAVADRRGTAGDGARATPERSCAGRSAARSGSSRARIRGREPVLAGLSLWPVLSRMVPASPGIGATDGFGKLGLRVRLTGLSYYAWVLDLGARLAAVAGALVGAIRLPRTAAARCCSFPRRSCSSSTSASRRASSAAGCCPPTRPSPARRLRRRRRVARGRLRPGRITSLLARRGAARRASASRSTSILCSPARTRGRSPATGSWRRPRGREGRGRAGVPDQWAMERRPGAPPAPADAQRATAGTAGRRRGEGPSGRARSSCAAPRQARGLRADDEAGRWSGA